jgi:uncharacterized Zn-finger protein
MDKLGTMDKAKQLKAFEIKKQIVQDGGGVKTTEKIDLATTVIEDVKIVTSRIGLNGEIVHDGDTNKTCKICNKTFTKPFGLKRHMLLHSGDKPHRCAICSFG